MHSALSPARPFEKVVVLKANHARGGRVVMMSINVCRDQDGARKPCQLILQILPSRAAPGTSYLERYGSIWSPTSMRGLWRRTKDSHSYSPVEKSSKSSLPLGARKLASGESFGITASMPCKMSGLEVMVVGQCRARGSGLGAWSKLAGKMQSCLRVAYLLRRCCRTTKSWALQAHFCLRRQDGRTPSFLETWMVQ